MIATIVFTYYLVINGNKGKAAIPQTTRAVCEANQKWLSENEGVQSYCLWTGAKT